MILPNLVRGFVQVFQFCSILLFDCQLAIFTLLERGCKPDMPPRARVCRRKQGVQPSSTASSTESIRIQQIAHLIVILPAQTGSSEKRLPMPRRSPVFSPRRGQSTEIPTPNSPFNGSESGFQGSQHTLSRSNLVPVANRDPNSTATSNVYSLRIDIHDTD